MFTHIDIQCGLKSAEPSPLMQEATLMFAVQMVQFWSTAATDAVLHYGNNELQNNHGFVSIPI